VSDLKVIYSISNLTCRTMLFPINWR